MWTECSLPGCAQTLMGVWRDVTPSPPLRASKRSIYSSVLLHPSPPFIGCHWNDWLRVSEGGGPLFGTIIKISHNHRCQGVLYVYMVRDGIIRAPEWVRVSFNVSNNINREEGLNCMNIYVKRECSLQHFTQMTLCHFCQRSTDSLVLLGNYIRRKQTKNKFTLFTEWMVLFIPTFQSEILICPSCLCLTLTPLLLVPFDTCGLCVSDDPHKETGF